MANLTQNSTPTRIAVAGVSGYSGAELVRLLLRHPRIDPDFLLFLGRSDSVDAVTIDHLHPQLTGLVPEAPLVQPFTWDRVDNFGTDVLLLATPHEQSREWVPIALERGLRVVDLSGAWRLKSPANRAVYNLSDASPMTADRVQTEAIFGSPELHREDIESARLVANPGCYATSIILALAPLIHANLIDLQFGIIADSKSGVSGAGKAATPKTHFMYAADNLSAYALFGHRHTGELLEQLSLTSDQIQFTPHLLPIPRGILSTIYLRLKEATTFADLEALFRRFYATSPMVRFRPAGMLPQIQHVVRTNFCDLGFALDQGGKRAVLLSCLDNLLKGAAGQAVQNLNIMLAWGESEGLL